MATMKILLWLYVSSSPSPNDKAIFSSFAYNDDDNNDDDDDVLGLIIEFTIYIHTT